MDKITQPAVSTPATDAPVVPARLPYVRPEVDSAPLFERMALACDDKRVEEDGS